MLTPLTIDLLIYQGATFHRSWKLVESGTTTPMDLTGYSARMQIREKLKSEDVILELTTANSRIAIDITSTDTTLSLYIAPEDTAAIQITRGVYDLELVDTAGDVFRLMQGAVTVSKEVTR